jgi:protein-S-isoprenylcysteine O-methyltransferase Ste14
MMDRIRYFLAVLNIVVLPCGLLYWFLIHPFARGWRKLGPFRTYLIVLLAITALGVLLFRWRSLLIGADLGTNWILVAIAIVLFVPMFWVEHEYKKHLSFAILSGFQELSPQKAQTGRMLKEGIYSVVRHPRYLSASIGIIAGALIANYVGFYILLSLLLPLGYAVVRLEERELIERFGDQYRQYRHEVPAIIPRWRR